MLSNRCSKTLCLAMIAVGSTCAHASTTTNGQENFTAWVGGSLMVDAPIPQSTFTAGIGCAPVIIDNASNFFGIALDYGIAAEAFYFGNAGLAGPALSLRIGIAGGDGYIGPGAYYVTRSKTGVDFRVGATFPFGENVAGFLPEASIGFRF